MIYKCDMEHDGNNEIKLLESKNNNDIGVYILSLTDDQRCEYFAAMFRVPVDKLFVLKK